MIYALSVTLPKTIIILTKTSLFQATKSHVEKNESINPKKGHEWNNNA